MQTTNTIFNVSTLVAYFVNICFGFNKNRRFKAYNCLFLNIQILIFTFSLTDEHFILKSAQFVVVVVNLILIIQSFETFCYLTKITSKKQILNVAKYIIRTHEHFCLNTAFLLFKKAYAYFLNVSRFKMECLNNRGS